MSQLPPSCHDYPLHVTITSLMSHLPPNVMISPSCHNYPLMSQLPPHVTITPSCHDYLFISCPHVVCIENQTESFIQF